MNCFYHLLLIALALFPLLTFAQTTIQLFNGKNLEGWYAYEQESGKNINAS